MNMNNLHSYLHARYYGKFVPPLDMASDSIPSYYPYGRNVAAAEMNGDSMLHGARDFFMESRPPSYSGLHPRMATGVASLQLSSQADTRKKRRAPESDGILSSSLYSSTPPNALMAKEETRRNGQFYTNFHRLLQQESPLIPPLLLRNHGRKESGPGKVKVLLRVAGPLEDTGSSWLTIDQRRKQVNLLDPSMISSGIRARSATALPLAPKMFSFDSIFSPDSSQGEICSASLVDLIHSVVNGVDATLISYGQAKLGKTYSVIGCDTSITHAGLIPCAISWLFKLVTDERERTGARFTIRVSAVEVSGVQETVTDLLADLAEAAKKHSKDLRPAASYLCDDPRYSSPLLNPNELPASSPEIAGQLLDACIKRRRESGSSSCSHLFFTLHVSQFRLDKNGVGGVSGGRNRLQLIDLGSQAGEMALSGVGNVILALINGQKHALPSKESKITQLLKDALNNVSSQTALLCHVSCTPEKYSETLSVVQMASRVHRMRRKRIRTGVGYNSAESSRMFSSSTSSEPSSSEVSSATTVIFCGKQVTDSDVDIRRVPAINRIQTNPNLKLIRAPSGSPRLSPRLPPHSLLKLTPDSPINSFEDCSMKTKSDRIEPILRPRPVAKPQSLGEGIRIRTVQRTDSFIKETAHSRAHAMDRDPSLSLNKSVTMPEMRPTCLKVTKQIQVKRTPVLGKASCQEIGIDSEKRDMIQKWVELQSPEEESPEPLASNFKVSASTELMIVEDPVVLVETCDVSQQVSQLEILHETHDICCETPELSRRSGIPVEEYGISQQDLEDLDALDTLASHLSSQLDLLSVELAESFVDDREVPVSPHIPEPMKPLLIIPSNGLITDIKENIWQLNTATFPRKETFMPEYGLYAGGTNSLRKKFAPSPPARSSSVPRQVREQFSAKNASKMARSRSVKAVKNLSSPTKTGLSLAAPSPDLSHDSGHDSGFSLSSAVCKMERKQAVYPAGNNKRSPSQSSSGHGSDGNSTVSSAPSTNSTGNGIDAVVPNAINSATVSSSTNSPERKMNRLEDIEENSKMGTKTKLWTKLPCFGGNKPS